MPAVLVAVLLLLAAAASTVIAGFTVEQKKALVVNHNKLRQGADPTAANMNFVTWSSKLEALAVKAADKCEMKHYTDGEYAGSGQNIYAGSEAELPDVSVITNSWHSEKIDMLGAAPMVSDGSGKTCKTDKVCGHYTQLMLAGVTEIGCGWSNKCSGVFKTIVFCQYSTMQTTSQAVYALGAACSACPKEAPSCYNSLCLTKELAANPGGGAGPDASYSSNSPAGGAGGGGGGGGKPGDNLVTTSKTGGRLLSFPMALALWQFTAYLALTCAGATGLGALYL